jgi:glycine hydroxymethyltransferase
MMYQYEEDMNKIYDLMRVHNDWMRDSVNLIASENTTSNAVTTAMASDLAHRYAEGQAYERLYQGCTYIDQIEDITKQLSCKVYDCSYANVQPVSGVTANLAAFFGFAKA